jgi:hypothetical protein
VETKRYYHAAGAPAAGRTCTWACPTGQPAGGRLWRALARVAHVRCPLLGESHRHTGQPRRRGRAGPHPRRPPRRAA